MLIDGKKIAEEIFTDLEKQVRVLPFAPVFCDILVGKDPVSLQYVEMKYAAAQKLGIEVYRANFPQDIGEAELLSEIQKINGLKNICGLIVQLPLPKHLNKQKILDSVDPRIDVDCLGSRSMDNFFSNTSLCGFPTAEAIMEILSRTGVSLKDKEILVIGQGQLVGRPVSHLLKTQGLNVVVSDSKTVNLDALLKNADVIISAAGQSGFVTGEKIKPGCVVIDAGTSETEGGILGDVDKESVGKVASVFSPVPGGVGPVTVAMLLKNVVKVAKGRGL